MLKQRIEEEAQRQAQYTARLRAGVRSQARCTCGHDDKHSRCDWCDGPARKEIE